MIDMKKSKRILSVLRKHQTCYTEIKSGNKNIKIYNAVSFKLICLLYVPILLKLDL